MKLFKWISEKKKKIVNPKKSFSRSFTEGFFGLIFALILAIIIRQMWFELYEIPTGSMRPTFREKDHVSVTKTAFGLNIPLKTDHFYFDSDLVQRGGIIVFTGEGIKELQEGDNRYFGVIPYDKRYVKRLIAKPFDTVYFYGGKVYGIDKEGNPLERLLTDPAIENLEHIPFLSFEGAISFPKRNEVLFTLFHQPLGKMKITSSGMIKGEIFKKGKWISENDQNQFFSFFGIDNFGVTKIIKGSEAPLGLVPAPYYLEISHHPRLYPKKDSLAYSPLGMKLETEKSYLPLNHEALETLFKEMYTARFSVKKGKAKRYSLSSSEIASKYLVEMPNIPDGMYEFYDGKAYEVGFGGNLTLLPLSNPLYRLSDEEIVSLYNLGIEFQYALLEKSRESDFKTSRYVYFREGDFYALGKPLFLKDSEVLQDFIKQEKQKKFPFIDKGAPFKQNGEWDVSYIKEHGLHIPEKSYLVLGDNHAMSADSRVFGFLPEKNIQGAPSLVLWPFGERWGFPNQSFYPFLNGPRLFVWVIAAAIGIFLFLRKRKKRKKLK